MKARTVRTESHTPDGFLEGSGCGGSCQGCAVVFRSPSSSGPNTALDQGPPRTSKFVLSDQCCFCVPIHRTADMVTRAVRWDWETVAVL